MAALLAPLLLMLLLPPGPALGNEGAAAGSCKCRREVEEPPIVKHFSERLQSCQTCPGDLLRFKFPQMNVCGHKMDPWAQSFWQASCNTAQEGGGDRPAMGAETSMLRGTPTPAPLEAAPGPGTTEEAARTPFVSPGTTTAAPSAPARARSPPMASGDPAAAGPSKLPLQEKAGAGGSRVAVMSLIGVALALVAVIVLLGCQRRRRGRRRTLAHHPGEEMRCLPCKET